MDGNHCLLKTIMDKYWVFDTTIVNTLHVIKNEYKHIKYSTYYNLLNKYIIK